MTSPLRRHLSFANVASVLALVVALGGTSYAAIRVTGRDVVDRSLTGADLKDGAVASRQLKDGGVALADLAPRARAALAGPAGRAGPAGARGPAGLQGATGEPGAAGQSGYVSGATVDILTRDDGSGRPAFLPLSGGGMASAGSSALTVAQPVPQATTITAIRLRLVPAVDVALGDHVLHPEVALLVNDQVAASCAPSPLTGDLRGEVAITATCSSLAVPLAAGDVVALRIVATATGAGSLVHDVFTFASVALTTG